MLLVPDCRVVETMNWLAVKQQSAHSSKIRLPFITEQQKRVFFYDKLQYLHRLCHCPQITASRHSPIPMYENWYCIPDNKTVCTTSVVRKPLTYVFTTPLSAVKTESPLFVVGVSETELYLGLQTQKGVWRGVVDVNRCLTPKDILSSPPPISYQSISATQ